MQEESALEGFGVVVYLDKVQDLESDVTDMTADSKFLTPAQNMYNELEKEAEILGVKNEVEIMELLSRFYPFAIDDVPTVPFIKAKLCLLIQSLPIYDLCSVAMQEAIQFLMMHILDCTPAALSEWMQHGTLTPLPIST